MKPIFFNTYPNPLHKEKPPTEVQIFDFFEIQSMHELPDHSGVGTLVEPAHDQEDDERIGEIFYGIYGHFKTGGAIHFADRATPEEAELLLQMIGVIP
jgi:hypothetical protein